MSFAPSTEKYSLFCIESQRSCIPIHKSAMSELNVILIVPTCVLISVPHNQTNRNTNQHTLSKTSILQDYHLSHRARWIIIDKLNLLWWNRLSKKFGWYTSVRKMTTAGWLIKLTMWAQNFPVSGFTRMIDTPVNMSWGFHNTIQKFIVIVHLVVISYGPVCRSSNKFQGCNKYSCKIFLSFPNCIQSQSIYQDFKCQVRKWPNWTISTRGSQCEMRVF